MQSLSVRGLSYRTRLLTPDHAQQFARCLEAHPHFRAVEVHESSRSAGRFFVAYLPANPERCEELFRRAQAVQDGRADAQADCYEVIRDTTDLFYWVHNLLSGDTYQTTFSVCDCPHFEHRCRKVPGLTCKHPRIVRIKLQAGEVREFAPPTPAPLTATRPFAARTASSAPAEDPRVDEVPADPAQPEEPERVDWRDAEPIGVEFIPSVGYVECYSQEVFEGCGLAVCND